MFFLYNLILDLFVIFALPFFLVKLVTTKKYRKGLMQRLGILPGEQIARIQGMQPIWVHAVSVGETVAAVPLVRALRRRYPEKKILVTTVTATGNQIARFQIKEADAVLFFPFDLSPIVKRVIQRIRPSLFILMETEIWPNCIRYMHEMQVPVLVVNGRISSASYRGYLGIRFLIRRVLGMVSAFSMQTEEDVRRIIDLGAPEPRVRRAGNIKFDRQAVPLSVEEKGSLRRDYLLPEQGDILIAGSTHRGEDLPLIDTYIQLRKEFPDLIFVLAPRHPERADEVASLLRGKGLPYQKRSRPEPGKPVLLLDTVGDLSRLYGAGTVSFVGGSLVPSGGQNILEPAVYGVPVVFGPHMENFPEISNVIRERGGGLQVRGPEELLPVLGDLLRDPDKMRRIGEAGMRIIRENHGALDKTLNMVAEFLKG
ncbi:MAG: 3-deoxy-D-manno-octulosonic acid transferase [bacterium]